MTRTLVIDGHPDPESLTAALARAYVAGAGDDAVALTLRDLDIDPFLHAGYRAGQAVEPDLARAREPDRWSEHITVLTPVWWGSAPALLKGFFDRALVIGWAFRYRENGRPEGLLAGRDRPTRRDLRLTAVVPPSRRRHHRAPREGQDDGVLRDQACEGHPLRRRPQRRRRTARRLARGEPGAGRDRRRRDDGREGGHACLRRVSGSLGGHPDAAVDADRLAVHVGVGDALDDHARELVRRRQPLGEEHATRPAWP